MESKPYDVVLLPEERVARKAIEVSAALAKHGTRFTLDGLTHYPHISLYMLQLADLPSALEELRAIAAERPGIYASAHHYRYSHEYLSVEYAKTGAATLLQDETVRRLNPLRDGLRKKDAARLATVTGLERHNILTYGYRSIGDSFSPHLTFTRFSSPNEDIVETLPDMDEFSGMYPRLGILEMGNHGTCIRLVDSWDLPA
jgi:hypothetical protein